MADKFVTGYGKHRKVCVECGEDTPVRQEFKDECDINRIMARYERGGLLPQVDRKPVFGDFSEVGDFQAAQELVARSRQQFESLSSKVRSRFNNRPEEFLEFVGDKSNEAEARALGLLAPEVTSAAAEEVKPAETK